MPQPGLPDRLVVTGTGHSSPWLGLQPDGEGRQKVRALGERADGHGNPIATMEMTIGLSQHQHPPPSLQRGWAPASGPLRGSCVSFLSGSPSSTCSLHLLGAHRNPVTKKGSQLGKDPLLTQEDFALPVHGQYPGTWTGYFS